MSAAQNGEIPQADAACPTQRDGLVAQTGHRRYLRRQHRHFISGHALHAEGKLPGLFAPARTWPFTRQAASVDQTRPGDRDILDIDGVDQAVAPVAVTEVLIKIERVRFRFLILAVVARRIGGFEHATGFQHQMDMTAQGQCKAEIMTGRQDHDIARHRRIYNRLYCGGIEGAAIARRTELTHIQPAHEFAARRMRKA